MEKKRIVYLDVLRVLACLMVLTTHSVMPNREENGIWLAGMSIACSASSELFLTLSGAILLPVHVGMREFYQRRFLKLLPPMLIWSIVGIIIKYVCEDISVGEVLQLFVCMPFRPVHGVYWFLYVMIGLYLFAPIISCWLREASKRQIEFFLLLWCINMLVPWINLIIPNFYNQDGSYYWVFCYFGGFLGYWIFGFYLRNYTPRFKSRLGCSIIVLSIVYPIALFIIKKSGYNYMEYFDNLQIGSACWVALIYMTVKSLMEVKRFAFVGKIASYFAPYLFGVYLMHPYILHNVVQLVLRNNRCLDHPILETTYIVLGAIFICYIIISLTMRIPGFAKYVYGLR